MIQPTVSKLYLQTNIIAQMLSIGGEGVFECWNARKINNVIICCLWCLPPARLSTFGLEARHCGAMVTASLSWSTGRKFNSEPFHFHATYSGKLFTHERICLCLRSAACHQLSVPQVNRSTLGSRAFSLAEPTVWNSLPDYLQDPAVDSEQFRRDLKTYLFAGRSKR